MPFSDMGRWGDKGGVSLLLWFTLHWRRLWTVAQMFKVRSEAPLKGTASDTRQLLCPWGSQAPLPVPCWSCSHRHRLSAPAASPPPLPQGGFHDHQHNLLAAEVGPAVSQYILVCPHFRDGGIEAHRGWSCHETSRVLTCSFSPLLRSRWKGIGARRRLIPSLLAPTLSTF